MVLFLLTNSIIFLFLTYEKIIINSIYGVKLYRFLPEYQYRKTGS